MRLMKKEHPELEKVKIDSTCQCRDCNLGKSSRTPHIGPAKHRATVRNYRIHSDVSGPHTKSLGKNEYVVGLQDDATRYSWSSYLKKKDERQRALPLPPGSSAISVVVKEEAFVAPRLSYQTEALETFSEKRATLH
ncbi:hypothetical protein BDZ88DRAFT_456360 [Geranomyces variabilis]|nr:hypothetical protein BDZ88DRAFT_456360 [Geranomyces variabilis]KAJ3134494.1 hypothetical protein HDU90_005110 [Geranomyces variabilis]